jgi:tetratricopeptide (TPR) repeat protein
MGTSLKYIRKFIIPVFLLVIMMYGICWGDIIKLKSGKEIEGKIEEEWDSFITLNMGSSVITIQRDTITTIVRSLYPDLIVQQAREALENGKRLMNEGKRTEARRFYEMEILRLEHILGAYPNAPEDIRNAKTQLEKARRDTIPPDPKSQEIEEIYQKALNALDRVRYEEAFQLLKQVGQLSPDRPDIQMKLGIVACHLNQFDEAIKSFQQVLEMDAGGYYGEVSPLLLDLLDKRGKQLLAENRAWEALGCYKIYLMLRSDIPQKPVDLDTFRSRYEACRRQSEEEIIKKIFQYADEQEMTELSLSAIRRIREIKPGDERIEQLASETEFLKDFKDVLSKGNYARAVRLKEETAPEILTSVRVTKKIDRIMQGLQPEARGRFLFLEASSYFQKGRFEDSQALFHQFLREFPDSPQNTQAIENLRKMEIEVPIEKSIRGIRKNLDDGTVDQADKEIRILIGREGVRESLQWNSIQECSTMVEKERKAREIWKQIQVKFKARKFEEVLELLGNIEKGLSGTFTGKKAARYLVENKEKIEQKIEEQRIIGSEIFIDLRDTAALEQPQKPSPEQEKGALSRFEEIMNKDHSVRKGATFPPVLWILALVVGLLICAAVVIKLIPRGREILKKKILIQEWEQGFVQKGEDLIFEDSQCRFCGLALEEGAQSCSHCGADIKIHEEELSRNRFNNFYGAGGDAEEDLDLREKELEEHFKVAEELADAGNTKAAFKMALMAYHDDPRQMKCLELLTALYEKMKKPQEAYLCYHRMQMMDPTNLDALHKIENFKSVLSSVPIRALSLISVLSLAFWWMVLWISMGLDPWWWAFLPRLGLCFLGFALTTVLWNYQLKRSFLLPEERLGPSLSFYHRICRENLRWKDLNYLSEIIQKIIINHTGIRVPNLTTDSLFLGLGLSILFMCSLIFIGWLNLYPAVLLAWIGGFILLFFHMEIYPRILTAHVLLRHFYEELQSSWADPEIPFKIHRLEAREEGEFNTKNPGRLPVSWALKPSPYKATRQGFLNSIMQTLNRHARFHCFYKNLKIENPFKIAWPSGFGRLKILTFLVMIIAMVASLFLFYLKTEKNSNYRMNMKIGYQQLLENRIESASDYLFNAKQVDPRGFAPDLYLGMFHAKKGRYRLANKSFSSAVVKGAEVATVHEQYAEFLRSRGRMNEAIREYKMALELEPGKADILNNIGMAYFNMSNYKDSITYLTQSVVFDPGNGRAYVVLGLAYEESGEKGKAREAFEKAVQATPQAYYAKLARNRIEKEGKSDIQIPQ